MAESFGAYCDQMGAGENDRFTDAPRSKRLVSAVRRLKRREEVNHKIYFDSTAPSLSPTTNLKLALSPMEGNRVVFIPNLMYAIRTVPYIRYGISGERLRGHSGRSYEPYTGGDSP